MRKPILFDTSRLAIINPPDYQSFGFGHATTVHNWGLYAIENGVYDLSRIDLNACRIAANSKDWWSKLQGMIVLDEEYLDHNAPDKMTRDHNHDQLIEAIKIYRLAHPGLAIAMYGIMPERSYASLLPKTHDDYKKWQARNRELLSNVDNTTGEKERKGLSAYVDRVCPSCKGWGGSFSDWHRYMTQQVAEAKIYNKPIFPFLMPQLDLANEKYPYYNDGTWGKMLDATLSNDNVDGVIVYQEALTPTWKEFDASEKWWQETVQRVESEF